MRRPGTRSRVAVLALAIVLLAPASGAIAGEPQEDRNVTFRLTLQGEIDSRDGFFIDVRCEGGEFCSGMGEMRTVFFCSHPVIVDTVECMADKPFEFTAPIPPQRIRWHLYRLINAPDPTHRSVVVLSGSSDIHGGPQSISLGYIYQGAQSSAPALPDTAMPSP